MQLEPARIESLLDNAWRLISQLRQWFAAWSLGSTDQDGLIELIRNLQLFWVKAEDLGLKRLARNSLAIEQFLERYCAGKLELSTENLNDVTAAVGSLQDLLLGFEAMREEPLITDLASLQKLERDTLKGFWSDASKRTIDVAVVADDVACGGVTTNPRPIRLEVVPSHSHPRLTSETTLHGLKPIPDAPSFESADLSSSTGPWPAAMRHVLSVREFLDTPNLICIPDDSMTKPHQDTFEAYSADIPEPVQETLELRRVLIVEDSLFYRNLMGMALRSVGYDSDSINSDVNAFETIQTERSPGYCAILVGQPVSPDVADAIVRCRDAGGVIVIGLTASDGDEPFPFTVNESVSKSNPRQLISLLNQLLNPISNVVRSRQETDFEPSTSARDAELRVG